MDVMTMSPFFLAPYSLSYLLERLDDASLVRPVPCTMRPLYDASLVRCVPRTMLPGPVCPDPGPQLAVDSHNIYWQKLGLPRVSCGTSDVTQALLT
jgi:hypothetical protein